MSELNIPKFFDMVEDKQYLLTEEYPDTMQINVGSLCNITCSHCHVDGGPHRKNNMVRETFEQIIEAFKVGNYKSIDISMILTAIVATTMNCKRSLLNKSHLYKFKLSIFFS